MSANSINIARVLAQLIYWAHAACEHVEHFGTRASFVIPTGNVGNSLAAVWTRRAGLPIDRSGLATNANRTIPDLIRVGQVSVLAIE